MPRRAARRRPPPPVDYAALVQIELERARAQLAQSEADNAALLAALTLCQEELRACRDKLTAFRRWAATPADPTRSRIK
jgi:hypothetical protein